MHGIVNIVSLFNFNTTLLMLMLALASSCASTTQMDGTIFRTDQNKILIDSIYHVKIQNWAEPYTIRDIETSYGRTNIIVSGKEENPAIFLIHAMGVNATMWLPNIEELSKKYRVYAINTIGDIGKSEHSVEKLKNHPKNGEQYANWLGEICDSLNLKSVSVVGASMGGWIALNFAVYQSERLDKLILLGSMGLKANYIKVMGKLLKVLLYPSEANKRELIAFALGDNEIVVQEMYDYMLIATACAPKLAPPKRLKKKELHQLKANTMLILGEEDMCIGDVDRNEKYANKYIQNSEVVALRSGHLINMEKPSEVNHLIIDFLSGETETQTSSF